MFTIEDVGSDGNDGNENGNGNGASTNGNNTNQQHNPTTSDYLNYVRQTGEGGGGNVSSSPGGKGKPHVVTSADVVTKFGYAPTLHYDDLALAEAVIKKGTHNERESSGINDADFINEVEGAGLDTSLSGHEDPFKLNLIGLSSDQAAELLASHGKNELPEQKESKMQLFIRQFKGPMPIMIWIAIVIEFLLLNLFDVTILLIILFTNAFISFYEMNKAGNAIKVLKDSLIPTATVKRDEEWITIDATLLVPGDTVLLASGSAVPADCRINAGEIDIDQSAITGESLPVTFFKNDSCKMGSTVVRGEVEATIEFTGANTFFGKTASMLQQNKSELSHLQKMLTKIMYILVSISVAFCFINFTYLLFKGVSFRSAMSFTIVLLVASIPLAIEIVTTATLAIGSKNLVKHGAIVTQLASIEGLAGMSILCTDKTGTLTLNQMVLQDETPTYSDGETPKSVLIKAALAAKWNEPARDALDRLTLSSVDNDELKNYEQIEYVPFDPKTKRTEGTLKDKRSGKVFKTSKGAPHIILQLLSDKDPARDKVEAEVARLGEAGIRSLAVASTVPGASLDEWKMAGLLTFLDPPRPDTKETLFDARGYGVQVKMITGDHLLIARNTALQLDLGQYIFGSEKLPLLDEETKEVPKDLVENYGDLCLVADGFAQVYPEHKYLIVECLRQSGYTVGMTGDGVNDAPALKRADVGIAVAGSTDAAIASADIVFTEEGLGAIVHGIVIAREIFARMSNFITYRISATLQLLFFFFIALMLINPAEYVYRPDFYDQGVLWPEFFHMPVLLLMLITVLNDGTLITIAYDNAEASKTPSRWNLGCLFVISGVLGAVSCLSSLLLLHFLLDSWNPFGFFQSLGMEGVQYGQIIAAIYLKVSVSDFLTLFSARAGMDYFFVSKPAPILLIGGMIALFISSVISIIYPASIPDGVVTEGLINDMGLFFFVWIYCIFWWFIQDLCKVMVYKLMYKFNFNQISTTGIVVLSAKSELFRRELNEFMAADKSGGHMA